ncbi:IclR family transcriptional regulator, partial [Streptomyces sp. SID161]|nr:IclR family transcriptional regulator [Streptomyces sp. SID161]
MERIRRPGSRPRGTCMRIEPTAPYHSAQDALRVLETVA